MIPKIHTGANVIGMVKYNANKLGGDTEDNEAQFLGVRNIMQSTTEHIIKAIQDRNQRSITKDPNLHISLNFLKDELIDNGKILEIADRYMELMNYENQPYAIYRHYDRPHPHIHIVSTQIGISGKKISDSFLHFRSMKNARQIEKEFNLIPAVEKSKKNRIETDLDKNVGLIDYTNIAIRQALEAKPTNFKEFDSLLKTKGIDRVEQEGGHYFEFDNLDIENVLQINTKVKLDALDQKYNKDFLNYEFKKNESEKGVLKKQVQAKIFSITGLIKQPLLLKELQTHFKKKGLELSFDTIQYGTHIDTINKIFITDIKSNLRFTATDLGIKTKSFLNSYVQHKDHNPT